MIDLRIAFNGFPNSFGSVITKLQSQIAMPLKFILKIKSRIKRLLLSIPPPQKSHHALEIGIVA